VDNNDDVVVTGNSNGGASGSDYYTAKYAAINGVLLWEKTYNGPANGDDEMVETSFETAGTLTLGPYGMVAITGSSDGNFSTDTTYDFAA
jgi:hypothetical protein